MQKYQTAQPLGSPLPEQTELSQQSRVGAALLWAGLTRCLVL